MNKNHFHHIPFVDNKIRRDKNKKPQCRQTVALILLSPDYKMVALYMPKGAEEDERLNWCPPQRIIFAGEDLETAAHKVASDKLGLELKAGMSTYLGSWYRYLDDVHPKANNYDSIHYHWVLMRANSFSHNFSDQVAAFKWAYVTGLLNWACINMSSEKTMMFKAALAEAADTDLLCDIPEWREQRRIIMSEAA